MPSDKRVLAPTSSNKQVNGSNSQVSHKIRNFFRISSFSSDSNKDRSTKSSSDTSHLPPRSESRSTFRQSRFIPHLGRNRSTTVNSEGHTLDEHMSPIANANPYFQHQGPPSLRHHNEGSVPPSPPDTPHVLRMDAVSGAHDQQNAAGRDDMARRLRRVASAPNAQGLFGNKDRPQSPQVTQAMIAQHGNKSEVTIGEPLLSSSPSQLIPAPSNGSMPDPAKLRKHMGSFRRTYSSNSIKVRDVAVGPSSFDKIKLIGKGDVGKVYLVREKKSNRLYAMKGVFRLV
jgi:protein-serine/threonine kinase